MVRALGLLSLAALVGMQLFPTLRPYRRRILGGALALYLAAGAWFAWRYFGG